MSGQPVPAEFHGIQDEESDMLDFRIDTEKCIQCGECAADCPYLCITMESGYPALAEGRENQCIRCQHCLAVCPTAALSILGKDPADSLELDGALPSQAQMETLLMGRRSTRRYTAEPLDPQTIACMLEVVGNAPTGVNNRGTLFTVVDDPAVLEVVRAETLEGIRRVIDTGGLPQGMEFFENFADLWEQKGIDVLFRDAPHLLLVTSPKSGPSPDADCFIALSYFELLAGSMGLGSLWNGLVKWAMTDIVPEMRARLGIPQDHCTGYAMVFGHPAVHYQRTVQRGDVNVNRVCLDG